MMALFTSVLFECCDSFVAKNLSLCHLFTYIGEMYMLCKSHRYNKVNASVNIFYFNQSCIT